MFFTWPFFLTVYQLVLGIFNSLFIICNLSIWTVYSLLLANASWNDLPACMPTNYQARSHHAVFRCYIRLKWIFFKKLFLFSKLVKHIFLVGNHWFKQCEGPHSSLSTTITTTIYICESNVAATVSPIKLSETFALRFKLHFSHFLCLYFEEIEFIQTTNELQILKSQNMKPIWIKYDLSAIYLETLISEIMLFFCLGNPGAITEGGGSESVS